MQFLVLRKSTIFLCLLIFLAIAAGAAWFLLNSSSVATVTQQQQGDFREIHLVTGEFKGTLENGKEIEAYRWDPGTIVIEKGEKVRLKIYGVNGKEHPFIIEGTGIKGIVKKGEETVVPLQIEKEGVYRLVCVTHPDKEHNGPMIAYIVVN